MKPIVLGATLASMLAAAAQAHVQIVPNEIRPGAETVVKIHVGHGCDGKPTTAIRVDIPRQLTMAHPAYVDGWTLTHKASGKRTTSITWRADGAPATAPDFQIHIGLPKTEGKVYLPVTQTCGAVTVRWNETPKAGKTLAHPAPSVMVTDHATDADAEPMDHDHH